MHHCRNCGESFSLYRFGNHSVEHRSRRERPAKRIKVASGKSVGNAQSDDEALETGDTLNGITLEDVEEQVGESGDQAAIFQQPETVAIVETISDLTKHDFSAAKWGKTWWIGRIENLSVIKNNAEIKFFASGEKI